MAREQAKVSVIIPAYNSADYTIETVESVLNQTYERVEVIVVDDGSKDHTREAMEPYADRIEYIYKENGGACSARNLGIGKATGLYLACLDCDDLWLPEKLEQTVAVLEDQPDLGFVCTSCYAIDADGVVLEEIKYDVDIDRAYQTLLLENYVVAPTVVMRKSCLERVGLFDESIFIPADWDLWLRLAREFPLAYIDKPLSKYRVASNYTMRHIEQCLREAEYVINKQFAMSPSIAARDRSRIMGRLLLTFAMLYSGAQDQQNARTMLKKAICQYPFQWRPYAHYMLSFLGRSLSDSILAIKRSF